MFSSLRSRLFVTYLATAGVVLALIALTLMAFLARGPASRSRTYGILEATASLFQQTEQDWDSIGAPVLNASLRRLDQSLNMRLILVRQGGRVVGDSRPNSMAVPQKVLEEVASVEDMVRGDFVGEQNSNWLYVAFPLSEETSALMTSQGPSLRSSLVIWGTDFLFPLARAATLALILSAVFAWWMSRNVSLPLRRMAEATTAITQGEYAIIDASVGPEDIRILAEAFNQMAEDLHATRQSQRDFVANVSHDLKTPLTSIHGFAQALLDGTAADDAGREQAARVIYEESDRLHRLVEDLLDLARLDAGQLKFRRDPVDLPILLDSVVEGASLRAASAAVSLEQDTPDSVTIIGDGDRLAQVFTNLVDNAIKHSPCSGIVRIWSRIEAGWITIHVDDQGKGIPEDELSRIFERFYQVDKARSSGSGVGLGLAIVKEIVEAHDGRIVAQSSPEVGSRFSVQLPIARESDVTIASR